MNIWATYNWAISSATHANYLDVYCSIAPLCNTSSTVIHHVMPSLTTSLDAQYYMDTRATFYMSHSRGTLNIYFPLKHHHNNAIVVANGHIIPVRGYGHSQPHPSLSLDNVLHDPKLIKNLISVRKFTSDNNVSVEFDPLGFSVKVLGTINQILRCNSTCELYPFPLEHYIPLLRFFYCFL